MKRDKKKNQLSDSWTAVKQARETNSLKAQNDHRMHKMIRIHRMQNANRIYRQCKAAVTASKRHQCTKVFKAFKQTYEKKKQFHWRRKLNANVVRKFLTLLRLLCSLTITCTHTHCVLCLPLICFCIRFVFFCSIQLLFPFLSTFRAQHTALNYIINNKSHSSHC